ncbi:AGE family epimerase/isomerase [Henriciella pelagia]|uniref:AGE family epimerase/isomerase n=1 Tax=Henriciella pelagia TaxID=1977912 RepID=UPI00351674B5
MISSALKRRAREARSWMLDACFPLWAEHGLAGHGLYHEALDLSHRPVEADRMRVRVQARQTYVFCEALRLGWERERAERLIKLGVNALKGPSRRAEGLIGKVLASDGSGMVDAAADLYDTAFALYALANAAEAGEDHALGIAKEVLAAVDRGLADPDYGGYAESLPKGAHRLQNPHMHLLEACHALHRADPHGGHLARANGIIQLFTTRMLDKESVTLGEYFAPDWSPASGEHHDEIEPGHQFEWVWLLQRHAALTGEELHPDILKLYTFALGTLDEEGRALTTSLRDGTIVDASRRTWMQTEALKAHLAMLELGTETPCDAEAVRSFDILMDEYLTPEGGWIDRFDADGQVATEVMPASTGYHVVLAFAELIRVTGV